MTEQTTHDVAVVERYVQFWNAETEGEQQRLARETFTDDIQYTAPVGVLTGSAALIGLRQQFADHLGAVVFRARDEVQAHHDRTRLKWEIGTEAADPFAGGTDVMVLSEDGRISSVTVFLDQEPEGFVHPAE